MSFLIPEAFAASPAGAAGSADSWTSILLLVGFVVIFYFLLWRPQSKRAKDHKNLVNSLAQGDEVVTSGGIVGKITKLNDDFISIEIADGVTIKVQKSAVSASLPKGSM